MILEPGSKVLVCHRRLFESDHARYFVGMVNDYDQGIARVTGYTWTRDGYTGTFKRKQDERTKIISIASGTVIVYQLASAVDLGTLKLANENVNVMLSDEHGFQMDLSEGILHAA